MKILFFPTYTPDPDRLIADRYNVIRQMGTNGVERTFLAQDLHAPGHPQCVLKQITLPFDFPDEIEQVREQFEQESKLLSALSMHDCIPDLLETFESKEHDFHLVQAHVEGRTLAQALSIPTPWSDRQVVALLEDVLSTLNFVHQSGVIHQNLQPDNLIRRHHDQRIVLINFGGLQQAIAHIIAPTPSINTPPIFNLSSYMPNEQIAGHPRQSSDVYAVGMIAIQALTGHQPGTFLTHPDTKELYWPSFATLRHPALISLLERMVKYNYRDRYQTAADVLEALYDLPEGLAPSPPIAPPIALAVEPVVAEAPSVASITAQSTTGSTTGADQQEAFSGAETHPGTPDAPEGYATLPKELDPNEFIRKREARRRKIPGAVAAVMLLSIGAGLWRFGNPLVLIGNANKVNADTVSETPESDETNDLRTSASSRTSSGTSPSQDIARGNGPIEPEQLSPQTPQPQEPPSVQPNAAPSDALERVTSAGTSAPAERPSGASEETFARAPLADEAPLTLSLAETTVNKFYEYVSSRSWSAVRALLNDELAQSLEPKFFYKFQDVSVENIRVMNQTEDAIDLMVQNTYVYPDGSFQEEERSYTVQIVDNQPTIVDTDFVEVIKNRSY